MNARKNIIERKFAVILNQHRMWGTILTPYLITREEGSVWYTPEECLSPFASPDSTSILSEEENEIIDLVNSFSDRNLYRLFSREKSVVDFLEKVTEERFDKFIKPYIEEKLYKCLRLIGDHGIPLYRQKTRTLNLHPDDLITISTEHATPVFSFRRGPDSGSYSLRIEAGGQKLKLAGADMDIISNNPAAIRYGDSVIFIDNLEAKKLIPFTTKEEVVIPGHLSEKYFSGFVLNIVNRNVVEAEGFTIEDPVPQKTPVLFLEHGIRNIPSLILKYRYESFEIFPTSKEVRFTRFDNRPEGYLYRRYSRDRAWESTIESFLVAQGFYTDDRVNYTVTSSGKDARHELMSLVEALNSSYSTLKGHGFEIRPGSVDKNFYLESLSLEIAYEVVNDWFDLKAVVRVGEYSIPFTRFRKNIIEDNREYILPDGKVLILPEEWFARYKSLFELGSETSDMLRIHKQHFSLLNDAFSDEECQSCPRLEKLVVPDRVPEVEPPGSFAAIMRGYQREGFNWLLFLQSNNLGGCLADDMGLGKTIQTLAMLQHNIEQGKLEGAKLPATLLVVPASLVHNWNNEIGRFIPDLKVCSYIGHQRQKGTSGFDEYDIILSSYHTIRQDIDLLSGYRFFYVILDESQVIKNPASQLYKTMIRLKSDHRLVLTGTPVENSLTDLWTQLNFLNPGLLGNLGYFRKEFAKPIEKNSSEEKEVKLNRLIRPFILRRTKEEVARDLPDMTEQTVLCDMSEEQAKMYEEEKSAIRNGILNNIESIGVEKSAIMILQGLMKLRQIANHPELAESTYLGTSGKFSTVLEDIRNVIAEGHKILVFSSFVKHLDLLAREFRTDGIDYVMLTGQTVNREKVVTEFQESEISKVFLISLKAGGTGLNLTAADYVFILDPWWNPAAESQALNRAHRIGQDKNVFVYRYISSGTIEEKIIRLQEKKSKLAETFISSNNPLRDLDIREMFELIG